MSDEKRVEKIGIKNQFRNPASAMDFANFREDVSGLLGKYAREVGRPCEIKVEITITELEEEFE